MMRVNQALCSGCGVCVDECPTKAITLDGGVAVIDTVLCTGCGDCIEVCPDQALAWVAQPSAGAAAEPSSLAVYQPPVEVIKVAPRETVAWRGAVLPAVAGALSWVGREVVPRLAPLALDMLDGMLDRRLSKWSRDENVSPVPPRGKSGRSRQRRRRRRKSGS